MQLAEPSDQEILQWGRLQNGEQHALAYFYEKYADVLLKYGLSVSYHRELIQDCVQELFIQVWNRRQNLSTPRSVKYYLISSLRRIIMDELSKGRMSTDAFPEDALSLLEHENRDQAEIEENLNSRLIHAVRGLPARQQEVVFLRFFEKMSYEDITSLTGLDYQVLRNTIHRSIKALHKELSLTLDLLVILFFFVMN
ncbi:MAG TPA: sigma-70 family RNA polymerase sigma factor [Dyadobacter sp.]|jgi:RNA polymerase sigma factor (sigma-70 family)|nr:sigma-70 family RNA polymerase sigma factor [Dyadobacter sp.]